VKPCVIIPCFNHAATLAAVVRAAQAHCPVMVVDDGSTDNPVVPAGVTLVRFEQNRGKAAALRAGFAKAVELGFTHAITMDADGQHFAEDLPKFLALAQEQPEALLVGVRDFVAAGAPAGRRRANAFSNFWFRAETGLRLADTQCGFRCYPLALTQRLRMRSERYAFELEFMVRAAWVGTQLVAVPVRCSYEPEQVRRSHFRPIVDFVRITNMNIGLVLQSWFVPGPLRAAWSFGEKESLRKIIREFFTEHAHDPGRVALAVGLGLFFGIAPIWGFQLVAALALAHRWRLNKAITAVASNISIPPVMPFILYGALALGHWMFTGQSLGFDFSPQQMTKARALEYLWQWLVGSVALAVIVATTGAITTYVIARFVRKR
jgi:uncharacterized protein (DUF2062 family)